MKETSYYEKLPSVQVAAELGADLKKGLSSEEAKERLEKCGLNEIPESKEPLWHRIFRRFWVLSHG